jgi:hypothetical protein
LPETGIQPALYLQMIQLQLDLGNLFGEIAPDIMRAHTQPSYADTFALRFDYHTDLLFQRQIETV